MNSTKLQAPVVLITGSSRRIGKEMCHYFHQKGYFVAIHYHHSEQDASSLLNTLNQIRPQSAIKIKGNLLEKKTPIKIIDATLKAFGRLDVLIHNASIFKKNNDTDWDVLFKTNVHAPYQLSLYARPYLEKENGCIIYITDIHAKTPLKDYEIYCETKAALTMQMLGFAKAFAPHIRVNAIAPGAIAWPEDDNALNEETKARIIEKTLLKQHGKPLYIAKAAFLLADNPFITGEILTVDGGRHLS